MTGAPLPPDDDDALAAEYVLGVLALPERLAAAARLRQDAGFAGRVAAWEARLAPLNADFPEVAAPDLLPQIEARLFPAPPPRPRPFGRWLAGLASGAAVAVLAVALLLPPAPPPPAAPPVIAVLAATEGSGPAFEAHHDGTTLILRRIAGQGPSAAEAYELWAIAPGAAPVSLGLAPGDVTTITTPAPPSGWVLAISREPAGGSPTGAPTGPVIAAGPVTG